MVKRRVWLTATVLALFGLQAPLCALACLESPVDLAPVAEHGMASPCHAAGSGSPDGSDRSPSDAQTYDDCGCAELAFDALLPGPGFDSPSGSQSLGLVAASSFLNPVGASGRVEPHVLQATDLPPPDILLLKSTFLI